MKMMNRNYENPPEIESLEHILSSRLSPISPRPGFVRDLGVRLQHEKPPQPVGMVQYIIVGLIGILSSVLIVLVGWKATLSLLGSLGLRRHLRHTIQPDTSNPLESAL